MKQMISNINNEQGSAIVIVLIILVLLTLLGTVSTNDTVIELQIVRNEAIYRHNFYKAEGAVVELGQIMEDNDISSPASYDWLTDSSAAADMEVVGNWNWTPGGNAQLSHNMNDAGDANNNAAQAAISNGIAGGASLDMTASNLFDYSVYGLFNSTVGQGRSLIMMGYRKRF
ncbi:MAG: PilX N-terminal domain-containing pilus assembly protein [Thermodesulfobacteriota bacterium]|nr:PilX N-terminal domain-containing pilus assembly protein [Thermodesulfobacteriota bacterium]